MQNLNRRFAFSPAQTGARVFVGDAGEDPNVERANRQATGASEGTAVVSQSDYLEGGRAGAADCREDYRPVSLTRTLPLGHPF